jgi:two-component system alkaline phosphatase synthesis response regulator PhoP
MPRILVIEDEPTIAMGLRDDLTIEGHAVDVAPDGRTGEALALERRHDLIVLDLMLPEKDGLSVCRSLRAAGIPTPIIMLTAKSQDVDKVLGLELGADDYVTKPFSPRELTARISAVLRRMQAVPAGAPMVVHAGDLTIDFGRYEVTRHGRRLDLTALEFRLLRALVAHRGQLLTHDRIIEEVWGKDVFMTDRVIYTHINNLRHKIEAEPHAPTLIIGVRGVGYRFDG